MCTEKKLMAAISGDKLPQMGRQSRQLRAWRCKNQMGAGRRCESLYTRKIKGAENWNEASGSDLINNGGNHCKFLGSKVAFTHSTHPRASFACRHQGGVVYIQTYTRQARASRHRSEFSGRCTWVNRHLQFGVMIANKGESVGCYESI